MGGATAGNQRGWLTRRGLARLNSRKLAGGADLRRAVTISGSAPVCAPLLQSAPPCDTKDRPGDVLRLISLNSAAARALVSSRLPTQRSMKNLLVDDHKYMSEHSTNPTQSNSARVNGRVRHVGHGTWHCFPVLTVFARTPL